ncbi:LuxR C-terminal-related transcriptional regulator [Erwinia sp. P6884]|uniref:helix-turn-helix transcriptional regulator n=1 Tax=Erwinia sp. P6884 TaxID=3141450 RepID=UPI003195BB6A
MNILIVSRDNFFISGTICLITRVWPRSRDDNPVFIISQPDASPLTPDLIISDVNRLMPGISHPRLTNRVPRRHVTVYLAAQCECGPGSICPLHNFRIEKHNAGEALMMLFCHHLNGVFVQSHQPCRQAKHSLSKQQAMVVKYTRQGMSLTDISRLTHLSVKTISTHKRAVMRKLGMKNNSEFYQYALEDPRHV